MTMTFARDGEKKTVGIPETARALGISRRYAYELIEGGRFPVPVLMVGGVKKVSVYALEAYLRGDAA